MFKKLSTVIIIAGIVFCLVKPQTVNAAMLEGAEKLVTADSVWNEAFDSVYSGNIFASDLLIQLAITEAEALEKQYLEETGSHLVTYGDKRFYITAEEYDMLVRIVSAEAGTEDLKGRVLVANVVLNRVLSDEFANSIIDVIFEPDQFAPASSGSIYTTKIKQLTYDAVDIAISGTDYSEGALYFVQRSACKPEALVFFDSLEYLFDHGVHTFYKE
ncbi:MAG: cell wall hydrolase [Lachnospiraceae bacterium]|nr:cell wall hydrolase [Lachnospiraceae bacterium]